MLTELVGKGMRAILKSNGHHDWVNSSLRFVTKQTPPLGSLENPLSLSIWRLWRPHVIRLLHVSWRRGVVGPTTNLTFTLAAFCKKTGALSEAIKFDCGFLTAAKDAKDVEPDQISWVQSQLAFLYRDSGQLEPAVDLLKDALNSAEGRFEELNPILAIRRSNLALVLFELNRLEEARGLLEQALRSDRRTYDADHPTVANREAALARVLIRQGHIEEAIPLLRHALESALENHGPDYPVVAIRQSNLAQGLMELGEFEEARQLLQMALVSAKQRYEPNHPVVLERQLRLALVLKELGRMKKSRHLLGQALKSAEGSRPLGLQAPRTTKNRALAPWRRLGVRQLSEARELLQHSLDSASQRFGPSHPGIAIRQENLALVLLELGQQESADDLLQPAYTAFRSRFGPNHPKTQTAWSLLSANTRHILEPK